MTNEQFPEKSVDFDDAELLERAGGDRTLFHRLLALERTKLLAAANPDDVGLRETLKEMEIAVETYGQNP